MRDIDESLAGPIADVLWCCDIRRFVDQVSRRHDILITEVECDKRVFLVIDVGCGSFRGCALILVKAIEMSRGEIEGKRFHGGR